jgi:hypothetical protein
MKKLLLALIFILPALGCASKPGKPDAHSLGIGGITLDDSEKTVAAKLGEPAKKHEQADYIDMQYEYAQLTIGFASESVGEITSSNPRYCTDQGLCPGDPTSKMRRLYGALIETNREHGSFLEYYTAETTCWYQFSAKKTQIESVAIICQP